MGTFKLNPLNQRGFHHVAILVVAFVLLFGIAGSYFYITSQAAAIPELESPLVFNGKHLCLDDHGDGGPGSHIDGWECNGTDAQRFSYRNGLLYVGTNCVGVSGADANHIGRYLVIASSCSPAPWGGVWTQSGSVFLNNHADTHNPNYNNNYTKYCLDIAGAANEGWVDVWPCNGGRNQDWTQTTYNDSTGGGNTGGGGGGSSAFITRARQWEGLYYNYGGGIHGMNQSEYLHDCTSGSWDGTPIKSGQCETDCSGFVSMVVSDVTHTFNVWVVGPSSSGTVTPGYMSGGHWQMISKYSVQPGDIVTRADGTGHVEFVYAGSGNSLETIGEHQTGTVVSVTNQPASSWSYAFRWE